MSIVAVVQRGYDTRRTFVNDQETSLTAPNIRTHGLARKFVHVLPGDARGIEGQVLIAPDVKLRDRRTMTLAIYSTSANLVAAFDAYSSAMIWARQVGRPVDGTKSIDDHSINDHFGFMGTGVLDLPRQTFVGVAWISPDGSPRQAKHSIHVVNLADGSPACAPVSCEGVSYQAPSGQRRVFSGALRKQRGALLLDPRGVVHIPFGSVSETARDACGWVLTFDLAKQKIVAAIATSNSPKGFGAGIWNAGAGLALTSTGRIVGATGNGTFAPPLDIAESAFALEYADETLTLVDWWAGWTDDEREGLDPSGSALGIPTATNKRAFDAAGAHGWNDMDFGSGGVQVSKRDVVYVGSKDGIYHPVNGLDMGKTTSASLSTAAGKRANYGKLAAPAVFGTYYPPELDPMPADQRTLNLLWGNCTHHQHGEGVLWEAQSDHEGEVLFNQGENGNLRAWKLGDDGAMHYMACSAEIASANAPRPPGGMPGGALALACDGTNMGTAALFDIIPYGDVNTEISAGRMLVYDACLFGTFGDGAKQLVPVWDSAQWDIQFTVCKFGRPVTANGLLYVPTYSGTVEGWGLAGDAPLGG